MEVSVKSRKVIVKGPRGILRRDFRHMAIDIKKTKPDTLLVEKWFGNRKELAAVKTVCSHVENMIKGVTKVGFARLCFVLLKFSLEIIVLTVHVHSKTVFIRTSNKRWCLLGLAALPKQPNAGGWMKCNIHYYNLDFRFHSNRSKSRQDYELGNFKGVKNAPDTFIWF